MMFNFNAMPSAFGDAGILDMAMALSDPASGISSVTIETAWLPPISSEAPLAGPPSPVLTFLKPKVTITLSNGQTIVRAPYGEPGPSRWPILAAALAVALGLGAYAAWRKLR